MKNAPSRPVRPASPPLIVRIWQFYRDGFRAMTWGRTLWLIILIKLFIMFAVLRVFFFKPQLGGLDEAQKSEHVGSALLRPAPSPQ